MKRISILSILSILCIALVACAPMPMPSDAGMDDHGAAEDEMGEEMASDDEMAEVADIVDTAIAAGSFTTLVAAVEAAGLVETLQGDGPFTVFAPTDDAFAALPEGTVEALLEDPEGALTDILLYHVVAGSVMAADVVGLDGQDVETVGGGTFAVMIDGDAVILNDSVNVVATDIEASNGVIHVIDSVLLPASDDEDMAGDSDEMAEEEASSDEASEDGDSEDGASEDGADSDEMAAEMADIVDTAVGAGSFTTLVAAVEAAGLVETLKGEGPFTVFAPTDDAFAALPEGTVEALLEEPEGALTDILLYHVVAGAVMAADVVGLDGQDVETAGGATFTVMLDGDSVMLNDGAGNAIAVVTTDIETSNGVIHVIDGILLPE